MVDTHVVILEIPKSNEREMKNSINRAREVLELQGGINWNMDGGCF